MRLRFTWTLRICWPRRGSRFQEYGMLQEVAGDSRLHDCYRNISSREVTTRLALLARMILLTSELSACRVVRFIREHWVGLGFRNGLRYPHIKQSPRQD